MKKSVIGIIILIIIIIAVVFAIGHKSNNSDSGNVTPPPSSINSNAGNANSSAAPGAVTITDNMIFTPSQISVSVGSTVTWTNNDNTTHTVVIDHGSGPNSGDIAPGAAYSYKFTQKGSYQYHCSIHPEMRGTIVVK